MSQIVLESAIVNDRYTNYLYEAYDIQDKERTVSVIPMISDDDLQAMNHHEWNVMVILGKSGSGKSTVLRKLGDISPIVYDESKCVISQFPDLDEEGACDLLCGVGLSSVPAWLRKPHELSNGEKARLDLCMALYNARGGSIAYVDEFTSVVNRDVAKSMSFALQRYVRRNNLKVVISSCHFDIIDWLQPDFIFNLNHRDEDGEVQLERMIYSDDKDYKVYQTIGEGESLSDKKAVQFP